MAEARARSCFGSALAAVIRAKRTTSEKSLLTHYLGTREAPLGPITSDKNQQSFGGYMTQVYGSSDLTKSLVRVVEMRRARDAA